MKSEIKTDLKRFTPRKEQIDALEYIKKVKKSTDKKFFMLNLPTGSGKSLLAMQVAEWYMDNINRTTKVDVITAGKVLQDQYDNTFNSIRNLKGIDNYTCNTYDCSCSVGREFAKLQNSPCQSCPYSTAKNAYINSDVSLTNFHLFLIARIYGTDLFMERYSRLLIVDEAHLFDETMSSFLGVKMTEKIIKKMHLNSEFEMLNIFNSVQTIEEYLEFITILKAHIQDDMMNLMNASNDKNEDFFKRVQALQNHSSKFELFLTEYNNNKKNWVMEYSNNTKTNLKEISVEPIWCGDYLEQYIWSNYDTIILMSGTILNKEIFSNLNGIDSKKAVYYSIPSPFNPKKRPIYYIPLGKMTYNKKKETFKEYVKHIPKLLEKYKSNKGIIHTNSFELSEWFMEHMKDDRLMFHNSETRDKQLREYFETQDPNVFVSPSVSTGVSFDDDQARFQIIAKMPYPSLASQKTKIRKEQYPEWYAWATVCGICQAYGRVVRSNTDYGDTIIIDESFSDVLNYSSMYIPEWIYKSIKKIPMKK